MPDIKINEEAHIAVISTAHMKQHDSELLEQGVRPMGFSMSGEHGYLFWSLGEDLWPEWEPLGFSREFYSNLLAVFRLGYRYVMIDQDAPEADNLPTFDW